MQIVFATFESMNFYCCVTGNRVVREKDGITPSSATKGYWLNEVQLQPEVYDSELAKVWTTSLDANKIEEKLTGAIDFLEDHPAEKWVALAFTRKVCQVRWLGSF